MAHQALARRYRPRRFAEVATQEHVSETLRRAVAGNRVGHAYLFCGPRGVGKTTLARVLAMALNCPRRTAEGEPCAECESCQRIWGGHTSLDVVEIDAASNRGVEDARDLRERAMYAPSEEGRYKVYIVDEAHMLTREAWNALLKILEEPPARVIFVFATTEPQKIEQLAAPILSRCQRFDFHRIGTGDIVDRLREVLGREGFQATPEALSIIARKAEGGMRDALSLLDQVMALTGGEVDQEAVRRVLGLVGEERYLELLDVLAEHRHGDVFRFVEALLDEGYDLLEFYHGWVDVLRTLLRARLDAEPDAGTPTALEAAVRERARDFEAGDLVRMLSLSSELESTGSLKRTSQPRLLLEMLLLRLSWLDRTVELEELIRGLGGVADSGSGGGGPVERPSPERKAAPPRRGERVQGAPPSSGAGDEPLGRASPSGPDVPPPPPTTGGNGVAVAWEHVLREGSELPAGITPFLRAATVSEGPPGTVHLSLPPGPAHDRLADPRVRRALVEGLSRGLGRAVELVVEGIEGRETPLPPPARVTPEVVRQGRLRELLAQEPLLERAVEELDLELLE